MCEVLASKQGIGVEIGSQRGIFAEKLLYATQARQLHLVDIWSNQSHYQEVICRFKKIKNVFLHQLDSVAAAQLFEDKSLDWIYLDADHSYEKVSSDLRAWLPKIKDNGWIFGHDYVVPNSDPLAKNFGVLPAVFEFCDSFNLEVNALTEDKWTSFGIQNLCHNLQQVRWNVFGMSRGGHHAIVDWIMSTYPGTLRHWNNCRTDYTFHGHYRELFKVDGAGLGVDVMSFENKSLTHVPANSVLVLRNILNQTASRLKMYESGRCSPWNFEHHLKLWKIYANEFISSDRFVGVYYDHWVSRKHYREILNRNFGPLYGDHTQVAKTAGGSSFSGLSDSIDNMDVLNRWQEYREHPEIQRLLNDLEINDLLQKLTIKAGSS